MKKIFSLLALSLGLNAATFTVNGTLDGLNSTATVQALFSVDTLTIKINGLVVNPTSVIQAVSGIGFTITGGLTGTLTSASGQLIKIHDDDNKTNANEQGLWSNAAGSPDWAIVGPGMRTSALNDGPDHLIVGAPDAFSLYSNANGSIAGNKPHNPFVQEEIVLVYNIPGATAQSTIQSMRIFFGTSSSYADVLDPRIPTNENPVPEPATCALIGVAIAGMGMLRKRN